MYSVFMEGPDVYQFPWPYLGSSDTLGRCYVTIYRRGLEPPTVVLHQNAQNHSTSITNYAEGLATQIYTMFLVRLGIQPDEPAWFQHYDDENEQSWDEVRFRDYTTNGYVDADFIPAQPVEFDRARLLRDTYYTDEIQWISDDKVPLKSLMFSPGECHEALTGTCFLSDLAQPDDDTGESGYGYCRRIAQSARAWSVVQHVVPESELAASVDSSTVHEQVVAEWPEDGDPAPSQSEVANSILWFRAVNFTYAIRGSLGADGVIGLGDGRHRTCVARHLGIPVRAYVTVERPTTKMNGAD